ncbi:MAG: MBL fold metallo-hydrolase [Elusimicrobia bacterium]|nr:MBL fold metallo-hydrolase [Elusimicrobiota bacterium]
MTLILKQLGVGPMANFAYLLCDPSVRECAVVDPGWDVAAIAATARAAGCAVTAVLLTHHHFDHSDGLPELLKKSPAPVYVHRDDAALVRPKAGGDLREVSDGDRLKLGGFSVEFLHTPGHTRGSQCLVAGGHLLTGDTLFIGACGRVDLPDSEPERMFESLKRIAGLPGTLTVWPGHAYGSASSALLSSEVAANPYLRLAAAKGREAFLRAMT